MGDPLENEHGNPDNCDTQQMTTQGLAYWRCSTNIMTFAALPDGLQHWALLNGRLVAWTGESPDPPDEALAESIAAAALAETGCVEISAVGEVPCRLFVGPNLAGFIPWSGAMTAYKLVVPEPRTLRADLTNLPADYDLYLSDGAGALLAQSVQEGQAPEALEVQVSAGSYVVYVFADPSRPVNPDEPYYLQLTFGTGSA